MNENIEDFYDYLSSIETHIDRCNDHVARYNTKLRRCSQFLESVMHGHEAAVAAQKEKSRQAEHAADIDNDEKAHDSDNKPPVANESRSIDSILLQARQLRSKPSTIGMTSKEKSSLTPTSKSISSSQYKHKTSPSKNEKSATKSRSSVSDSRSGSIKHDHPVIKPANSVDVMQEPDDQMKPITVVDQYHLIMDRFEQARSLLKGSIPLSMESEIFQLKCSLASAPATEAYPTSFPPISGLYAALKSCHHQQSSEIDIVIDRSAAENLSILTSMLRQERINYEKKIKPRLQRLKIHEIDRSDVVDIFRSWYKLRCIDDAVDRSIQRQLADQQQQQQQDGSSLKENVSNLLDELSLSSIHSSRSYEDNLKLLEVNAHALASRSQYLIELIIAKYLLKSNISSLKQCCQQTIQVQEMMSSISREGVGLGLGQDMDRQWRQSLSTFRDLYTTLSEQGEDFHASKFFAKAKM
jgi:hypothetical protein